MSLEYAPACRGSRRIQGCRCAGRMGTSSGASKSYPPPRLSPNGLHPAPCTLHPAPCTLHPAPCIPQPSTLNPQPPPRTPQQVRDQTAAHGRGVRGFVCGDRCVAVLQRFALSRRPRGAYTNADTNPAVYTNADTKRTRRRSGQACSAHPSLPRTRPSSIRRVCASTPSASLPTPRGTRPYWYPRNSPGKLPPK